MISKRQAHPNICVTWGSWPLGLQSTGHLFPPLTPSHITKKLHSHASKYKPWCSPLHTPTPVHKYKPWCSPLHTYLHPYLQTSTVWTKNLEPLILRMCKSCGFCLDPQVSHFVWKGNCKSTGRVGSIKVSKGGIDIRVVYKRTHFMLAKGWWHGVQWWCQRVSSGSAFSLAVHSRDLF